MAHYRNFDIEMTIVPDVAGQYEAAFAVSEVREGRREGGGDPGGSADRESRQDSHGNDAGHSTRRYKFPPVGSYLTPDDAREQTEAWARKWIDENFPA